jgi:5-methylcytosine-specific restriction endonuclease McrA
MLSYEYDKKTVQDIFEWHGAKRLNLSPGFQRKSIWSDKDRRKLVGSVYAGYPLPSIFLYRRHNRDGAPEYDVIDGKQRIESLLMFTGKIYGKRFHFVPENAADPLDWKKLHRMGNCGRILGAQLQVAFVQGDWEEIVDLFVRINSTGKRLDRAEVTRARFLNSALLQGANRLARRWSRYFIGHGILAPSQVERYKHVELICELIVSSHAGGVISKKDALDKAMQGTAALKGRDLHAAMRNTDAALRQFRILIRNPRETRFKKVSDFYSLVVVLQRFVREKFVLQDRTRNDMARQMLKGLSSGVDAINEKSRKLEFSKLDPDQEIFRSYLQTVKEGTDALANRRRRDQIICDLIAPIFEKRDERRLFNEEQRRILWNSAEEKRCPYCPTSSRLHWSDLTIDHVKPHALGGRTDLRNAQICCRKHNSKLGMKTKRAA